MNRVVMFSGGIGSWGAARRVADSKGTEGMVLLFADTRTEDEDTYRFLSDASTNLGVSLTTIADGRDVWEVFRDKRFIGNSRIDPCSRILKRELMRRWLDENCRPEDTEIVIGFDWTEVHRLERARPYWTPWSVSAPLCDRPLIDKPTLLSALRTAGIAPPRLYAMGFAHNNCGGFCVKAGQAQFAHLLRVLPERYAHHEAQEEEMRTLLRKDVSVMKRTRGGVTMPLTMRAFREEIVAGREYDQLDLGGCGCMEETEHSAAMSERAKP